MRPFLLKLLQLFFRSEQPTASEWKAYQRQQGRHTEPVAIYAPECEIHVLMRLERLPGGLYRCPLCQQLEGPHTDPLQPVAAPQPSVQLPPGQFAKLVNRQEGRTIHTRLMRAISKVELVQLQAQMKEQEGHPK